MKKYIAPIPGKFYRFLDTYVTDWSLGAWQFIAEEGNDFRFHLTFSGSDEIEAVDEDVVINIVQYSHMIPDPKGDETHEIVERINASDEWDSEDCRRLCELAGVLDEWEEAEGETFEAVVRDAAEILNCKLD